VRQNRGRTRNRAVLVAELPVAQEFAAPASEPEPPVIPIQTLEDLPPAQRRDPFPAETHARETTAVPREHPEYQLPPTPAERTERRSAFDELELKQ
jgi:hypothetical protein